MDAMPMAAVSDLSREIFHRFVPFNFLLFLATPHLHGVLVLVTGNKFIASVVVPLTSACSTCQREKV
jgi:hypothetical protein